MRPQSIGGKRTVSIWDKMNKVIGGGGVVDKVGLSSDGRNRRLEPEKREIPRQITGQTTGEKKNQSLMCKAPKFQISYSTHLVRSENHLVLFHNE